jgi:hypothetical protein
LTKTVYNSYKAEARRAKTITLRTTISNDFFEQNQLKVNRSLFCDDTISEATAELLVHFVARIVYFLRSAKIDQAETLQAGRSLDWPLRWLSLLLQNVSRRE